MATTRAAGRMGDPTMQNQGKRGGQRFGIKGSEISSAFRERMVVVKEKVEPIAGVLRRLVARPGILIMFMGSMIFLAGVAVLVTLSLLMTKCNSDVMPCKLDTKGSCRCSIRTKDGSCWKLMSPAMKCYKTRTSVDWGICQGHYETKLCGTSQSEVDTAMRTIASSYTELHPEGSTTCNLRYDRENIRCQLPVPRAPAQTCETDIDCCDCGSGSPACLKPLSCFSSAVAGNGSAFLPSQCGPADDACVSYSFSGCDSSPATCFSSPLDVAIKPSDQACCADGSCSGAEQGKCRSKCNVAGLLEGCPCFTLDDSGCTVKRCVNTANFFPMGGVRAYLERYGATNIKVCTTDNCNLNLDLRREGDHRHTDL